MPAIGTAQAGGWLKRAYPGHAKRPSARGSLQVEAQKLAMKAARGR